MTAEGKMGTRDIVEAAREEKGKHTSFAAELFMGRLSPELIHPYPEQDEEDRLEGDKYLTKVENFLLRNLDPEEVDRTGELPQEVVQGLMELGCFGMIIPKEFGGLGFSQVNYNRVIALISSYCTSTGIWVSAHQSIGVPQPLKLFGTAEQKKKYLPRLAKGEISAFALTEPDVGSDPARMKTTAIPVEGGDYYILNGEKLWCTNGPVADLLVVVAQTPSRGSDERGKMQFTAFIIERTMPGFEVVHRCQFMGLRAIQNGLLRFRNVRISKENILGQPGAGLKVAFSTLNIGRVTLPAACVGVAKRCLEISRIWANRRHQWGGPIGKHEAIAEKLARMAAYIFAMESVTQFTSLLVDSGNSNIRLEAAMAKMFNTEAGWRIADDTMQIFGGRGYEKVESLRGRGEELPAVERIFRDSRINIIIEGTSEIMRLFIAREAVDPHLRAAGYLLRPNLSLGDRIKAGIKASGHFLPWYVGLWFHWGWWPRYYRFLKKELARHFRFVDRTSRQMARAFFHCMALHGTRLEQRQMILGRLVEIGTELFAMAASCSRAHHLLELNPRDRSPLQLADLFCRQARRRIAERFRSLYWNEDRLAYKTALEVLEGNLSWLEDGIVKSFEMADSFGYASPQTDV